MRTTTATIAWSGQEPGVRFTLHPGVGGGWYAPLTLVVRWLGLLPISLLQPLPFRPQNPPAGAECHPSLA
jgi:hypothetical protein